MDSGEKSSSPVSWLRRVGGALGALALCLFWLVMAGAYYTYGDRFSPALGILYGLALTAAFVGLHIVRPLRRSRGVWLLLRQPSAFEAVSCLIAAAAVTLANVAWVLAFTPIPGSGQALEPTYVAFAVLLFPLIEEFSFRAWLPIALTRLMPAAIAIGVSAALFAALHGKGDWTTHLGAGLSFSAAVVLTGSIWSSVLMHVTKNALVLAISANSALNAMAATVGQQYHSELVVAAWVANLLVIAVATIAILRRPRERASLDGANHS